MAGRFSKTCGTEFIHDDWRLQNNEIILNRCHIKSKSLAILDKVYKDKNYRSAALYCQGCINHVEKNCTDCGKQRDQVLIKKVDACCGTDFDFGLNIAGCFLLIFNLPTMYTV